MISDIVVPPRRTGRALVRHLALSAWRMEKSVWLGLHRLLLRRPRVPAGATGFTHHRQVLPVMIVFIVLAAVEIPAIDLLVHRWPLVRIPLLVVGLWGLTFAVGFAISMVTRPHAVGSGGLLLRSGSRWEAALDWSRVGVVRRSKESYDRGRSFQLTENGDGTRTLHLPVQNETNVLVRLLESTVVDLPHGRERLSAIRFFADDPAGLVAAAGDARVAPAPSA